ncbi:codeine O-demethylase-like [Cornus florida]|uniref:codeine O-demethylase-like n=1 Tax=Cornus florida TaxID=4283 RepID=UPI00289AFC92|nr:codeine O-demethylase-like [Cornus florida]
MAATPAHAKKESLSKPVQELAINGDEPPQRYVYKGDGVYKGGDGAIHASSPLLDVPVIDVGLLTSSSPTRKEELGKLQSALSSCGCFQAINHGITNSFLDEVQKVAKQFFAFPTEEKQKCSRALDDIEGYGNDTVLSENQILDWTDRLYLTVYPEDQRKLELWPENPENFREILDEYTTKLRMMNELVLKAMANSLDLEENCFLNQFGEKGSMTARFNLYPPCPRPDLILGVKPHADGSAITFLLQDKEVEGLQILKDDQWFRVPIIPHALLINVGDQAEIMSNGIFKSPVHRVVTNSVKERITLAVFCMPDLGKEIGPVEQLINEKRPRLYKKVKNYVDIYFQNYQQGKRPIEAAKI